MHSVLLFDLSVNRETWATPHRHADFLSRCIRMVGELLTTAKPIRKIEEARVSAGNLRVFARGRFGSEECAFDNATARRCESTAAVSRAR
jgi:hypothetical protein